MTDMISRQAAIEHLRNNIAYMQAFGCDRSITLIKELPSAQPLQGTQMSVAKSMTWTPVTDALPIKSGVYLVCNTRSAVFTAMYLGSHWGADGVIAWMETPEPYKEDDHEPH